MKGLQVRCGSSVAAVVSAWGATPVTLDQSEVYEAARNGLIDGMVNGVGMAGGYHTDEIFSNITVIPFYNQSYTIAANEKIFDKMTPKQVELFKEAVDEVFVEYATIFMGNIDNDTAAQEAINKTKGFAFMSDTPGLVEEFYAPLGNITSDYVKILNDQGLDGDGALAQLQVIADKYNAQYPEDQAAKDLYLKFRD
jgi:TRAP-type C4-dicarboxylate transport system substrate-binding protein